MAYQLVGEEGSFTTTAGDAFYTALFGTNNAAGLVSITGSTLTVSSTSHDITPLNTKVLKSLSGLRSFTAGVSGFVGGGGASSFTTPRMGNEGLVTMTSPTFYTTNARGWSLTLEPNAVHDITKLHASDPASGPTWRSFRPGNILRWYGSYTCDVDSATIIRTGSSGTEPIQAPSITDDTASTDLSGITLTYGNSATDETFTGEVQVTGYSVPVQVGSMQRTTFSFVGSGNLAAAGTNNLFTGGGISGGNIQPPVWGDGTATSLVARFYEKVAATARHFETADMFWRSLTISCQVDQPVSFSMSFVGNGALTSN